MKKEKKTARVENKVELALTRMGYIRLGEAAKKLGKPITFLHHAIKGPTGGRNGPRLRPDTKPPEWIRTGFLYYVYEPALRRLVGEEAARICGLRTEAEVRTARAG